MGDPRMHRHDPGSRTEGVTEKENPVGFRREDPRCDLLEVGDRRFNWVKGSERAGDLVGQPLRKLLTFSVSD